MFEITRKSKSERKKEIIEATLELVGEKGIGLLRTSEIAERVGFSEAALYKHFSTKKDVITATIRAAGKELIESLSASAEEAETDDNLEKIRRVFKTHMRFIQNNPGITRLLFSDEVHFNEESLQKELLNIINKYKDLIKSLLRKGIEKNQIREDIKPDSSFSFYFGMIQAQILFWSLSGGEKSLEGQMDELWMQFKKLVGKGSDQ